MLSFAELPSSAACFARNLDVSAPAHQHRFSPRDSQRSFSQLGVRLVSMTLGIANRLRDLWNGNELVVVARDQWEAHRLPVILCLVDPVA